MSKTIKQKADRRMNEQTNKLETKRNKKKQNNARKRERQIKHRTANAAGNQNETDE
jgi:hypothetical protein